MTFYINPYGPRFRRRNMSELLNELETSYEPQVSFPMDVKASSEDYQIKAYLPGVSAENIDIQIVNEVLTISGEIKLQREESSDYLLTELPSGRFHRVISLPTPLDPDNVEASLENGILTIAVPKAVEAKPRTVKITSK